MSNIRKTVISNPEKQFLIKNLQDWRRLDGRAFDEFRDVQIEFGKDWGCCFVSLGKTRVIAQVACELQVPKSSRPSEGILSINLELNPMADPNFEAGRQSELSSQLNRLLEKCIINSKAVDLESLCVKMNERVWSFRVDLNLINHEGNILDCASIAALAALAHFRRPDVTSDGMDFKIHSIKERDPIPTVIHHYPVCITYAIFCDGDHIIADPTLLEEGVAEAFLSVGLNAYKELCGLHLGGKAQLSTSVILETTNKAARRACQVIEMIKTQVEKDTANKLEMKETGFHKMDFEVGDLPQIGQLSLCLDHWQTSKAKKKKKKASKASKNEENEDQEMETNLEVSENIVRDLGGKTAELLPNNAVGWVAEKSDESDISDDEIVCISPPKAEPVKIEDTDSEEDDVVVLKTTSPAKRAKKKKNHLT